MASKPVCSSCLRLLRQSARTELQASRIAPTALNASRSRPFTTTPARHEGGPPQPSIEGTPSASTIQKFALRMRAQNQMRAATEPYVAYGSTQELIRICVQAGEYEMPKLQEGEQRMAGEKGEDVGVGRGWWYEDLGLLPTFNTWAQITFLHMYLLTVRLRHFPPEHAPIWHQNLLDHFFYAAEDRMVTLHSIAVRSLRNRYLKDLYTQWRGTLVAYDEGLIKGDAVLGAAVWRNLWGGREDVDVEKVALVVSWMRKSLRELERLRDQDVAGAEIAFPDPARERGVVERLHKDVRG